MLREWLWRGGRLRTGVTRGLFFGIPWGVFVYLIDRSHSVLGAIIGGGMFGAFYGTVMALAPVPGAWWCITELRNLPQSDRVAVLRAVACGEPVSDPRLAPGVIGYAEMVMASWGKRPGRTVRWMSLALAALAFVGAVAETITGPAWMAGVLWAEIPMLLTMAWRLPGNSNANTRTRRQQRSPRPIRSGTRRPASIPAACALRARLVLLRARRCQDLRCGRGVLMVGNVGC